MENLGREDGINFKDGPQAPPRRGLIADETIVTSTPQQEFEALVCNGVDIGSAGAIVFGNLRSGEKGDLADGDIDSDQTGD